MSDPGRDETDEILDQMEEEISAVYSQAYQEAWATALAYMKKFRELDKKRRKQVQNGEWTEQDYKEWRKRKLMGGKRWFDMVTALAKDFTHARQIADSIINGYIPEVYAVNHNYGTYVIEKGFRIDTTYTLYDRPTVERLLRDKPDLLPPLKVDVGRDIAYNSQRITAAVTQGILQGDPIDDMANRIKDVANASQKSAVLAARTATTNAENAGRYDSAVRGEEMGLPIKLQWVATLDLRTRETHRKADGERIKVGDKFSNGLRYPGDRDGAPEEIWNCRCRIIEVVGDVQLPKLEKFGKLGDMTYDEWKNAHDSDGRFKRIRNIKKDKAQYHEYRSLLKGKGLIPRKFADFQSMKYDDPDKWKKVKAEAKKARAAKRK